MRALVVKHHLLLRLVVGLHLNLSIDQLHPMLHGFVVSFLYRLTLGLDLVFHVVDVIIPMLLLLSQGLSCLFLGLLRIDDRILPGRMTVS